MGKMPEAQNFLIPPRITGMDGRMNDRPFYFPFNSVSVLSGQWACDNERLCAMELCL